MKLAPLSSSAEKLVRLFLGDMYRASQLQCTLQVYQCGVLTVDAVLCRLHWFLPTKPRRGKSELRTLEHRSESSVPRHTGQPFTD